MIERKDINGNTIFIDHDHGEIHFSDKHNVVRLTSQFDLHGSQGSISEFPFGTFMVPSNFFGQGLKNEKGKNEPPSPTEGLFADEDIPSPFDDTLETQEDYIPSDELLASEDVQHITEHIKNSTYSAILLYLTPKKLTAKDAVLDHMDCELSILDKLVTYGFLKENHTGELFFTFKGLVVRGELEKMNKNNLQYQINPILA